MGASGTLNNFNPNRLLGKKNKKYRDAFTVFEPFGICGDDVSILLFSLQQEYFSFMHLLQDQLLF